MPSGRYTLRDPHDHTLLGTEHFHCAPGPSGWRYTARIETPSGGPAGTVDLTTDRRGRPLRLELRAGSWQVRGTALDGVTWVRTDPRGELATEGNVAAHAFTGASPAFLVANSWLLPPGEPGEPGEPGAGDSSARARLVSFTGSALAPRTIDQSWSRTGRETHTTDSGPLVVDSYRLTALDTAEQWTVHIAGDVVLDAPGVALEHLDSPPSGPS
ncbi:hypothetical protein E0L36_00710 [Streptomyces sp. AJS327]|uniref:hypothetical protein n=1 Tax=Streptomyces sp. AJS327 TaxID=2545265 RepID=UPI0015DFC33A|nr:hypothetical protein [Streptomyces sp. AJS327]MBA0049486.1 hypothetical protein [Streptomyces sp. AJS327]